MGRVRAVVAERAKAHSAESLRKQGIDLYFGTPTFEAYDTLLVDNRQRIESRRFAIATGSRPAVPAIPGLNQSGSIDSATIWRLNELPDSLLVIGAGPVGLELGQALARLGTQVTILCDTPHILPREDPAVADAVQALLAAEGITFHTNVEITAVEVRDGSKVCKFRSKADGSTYEAARSQILVAAGRIANVEGLNLDGVGIHADPVHGIEVDDYLRTHTPNIWAIGDVLGRHHHTHAATREAAVVFQNAVLRRAKKISYATLPRTVFIDPEVASVGTLSIPAQTDEIPETRLFHAELTELDRAHIDGRTAGFAKLLATPSGRILGATIVGPEASLVLQEVVLAMENRLTLRDILNTIHTYPTYAGLARALAVQFGAARLEKRFVQRALRWFYGFEPRTNSSDSAPAPAPAQADTAAHAGAHGH
jgi:pyruvate/2-oxoglutarate dehydrogenase complex dihydrolipoamide dehydrogenase (E3) component